MKLPQELRFLGKPFWGFHENLFYGTGLKSEIGQCTAVMPVNNPKVAKEFFLTDSWVGEHKALIIIRRAHFFLEWFCDILAFDDGEWGLLNPKAAHKSVKTMTYTGGAELID